MIVRATPWDSPDAALLREAQRVEISGQYGVDHFEPGVIPTGDDMAVFLIAYKGDEPVACGGLRTLDDASAEIKRMYVTPPSRGTGVATTLLRALEKEARERGFSRLLLETGSLLAAAIRFYEREGYTRIPNFGHYAQEEDSRCFMRVLHSEELAASGG